MTASTVSRTQTQTTLTCDQCGVSETFSGYEPLATPGWITFSDPFRLERFRLHFNTVKCAADWLKPKLEAARG